MNESAIYEILYQQTEAIYHLFQDHLDLCKETGRSVNPKLRDTFLHTQALLQRIAVIRKG